MAAGFYPAAGEPVRAASASPGMDRVGVVVIHGVGDAEAGWMNEHFIPRLTAHPAGPAFADHSEVYDLPDRGRNRPGQTFRAFVRRGRTTGGHSLAVMELTWGDLSRIGTGSIANWLVMLKLFYEAPQVLGDCFFDKTKNGLATTIALLVRLANWILRWPITGLNIVALLCAVALLARQKLMEFGGLKPLLMLELSHVMVGLLALLAVLSLLFARWRVYRDIALTDIGMSTMMFSALSAAAILVTQNFIGAEVLSNPAIYLMAAGVTIFGFWLIWNYAVFIAIMLLVALGVQQMFAGRRTTRLPVIRPAAAVSLSVAQGVLYKIVIALLWIFIFVTLDFNERTEASCLHDPVRACAYLADVQKNLIGIVVFNLIMVAILGVTFFLVAMMRALLRVPARRMRSLARYWMPRMVVSPLAIFILLAGTIFNLVIFYWRDYIPVDFYKQADIRLVPWQEVVKVIIGGGSALSIAFYAFRALQHASRGILHIVRDLVDHQFTPRFTLSRYLLPRPTHQNLAHPRRARIESRLDVLLKEIVDKEGFDRLVFVAHSQGSVILHDYLSTTHDDEAIQKARAIDVLTLGSPLTHLYKYYFAKYAALSTGPEALNPRLTSWTNLWRVDDPIGNRIEMFDHGFIRNAPLRPGGHVDYWKERDVLEAIVDLTEGRPVAIGRAVAVAVPAAVESPAAPGLQAAPTPV